MGGRGRKKWVHRHDREHSNDSGDGDAEEARGGAVPKGKAKRKKRPNAYEKIPRGATTQAAR